VIKITKDTILQQAVSFFYKKRMELNLTKPLAFFDIESTGINVTTDRIVEISIVKVLPNNSEEELTLRVNPTVKIPKETTKIHGITNEDVEDCPTFAQKAREISDFLKGCDLAGYNSNRFDVPILVEEFLRADVDFDMRKRKLIDVQTIFHKKEQRTLTAAYKFYCKKELVNAHSASADTIATYEVLKSQLDMYDDLENNAEALSKYSHATKNVDFAGRIVYGKKNKEVFNFGKHKGKPVEEVFQTDPGFYNWMMNADFPRYTKKILTEIKLRNFGK